MNINTQPAGNNFDLPAEYWHLTATYKKWITNCTEDSAFEYLVRYTVEQPDAFFTIGPPHPVRPYRDW